MAIAKAVLADALYRHLRDDVPLSALLAGGVQAAAAMSSRTERPYVVVGDRTLVDDGQAGAMGTDGGTVTVTIHVFSAFTGPQETEDIQARIRALIERVDLPLGPTLTLYGGSLAIEDEHVFEDFDADMPDRSGFHGVQRATGLVEAAL